MPITKVYGLDGTLVHDCEEAGCAVSWDGYVLDEGQVALTVEALPEEDRPSKALRAGDPVPNREDPGPEWDVSVEGVARLT